jgi:hypothetical protein
LDQLRLQLLQKRQQQEQLRQEREQKQQEQEQKKREQEEWVRQWWPQQPQQPRPLFGMRQQTQSKEQEQQEQEQRKRQQEQRIQLLRQQRQQRQQQEQQWLQNIEPSLRTKDGSELASDLINNWGEPYLFNDGKDMSIVNFMRKILQSSQNSQNKQIVDFIKYQDPSNDNTTVLHEAVSHIDVDAVQTYIYLIRSIEEVNFNPAEVKNDSGKTPLDVAQEKLQEINSKFTDVEERPPHVKRSISILREIVMLLTQMADSLRSKYERESANW